MARNWDELGIVWVDSPVSRQHGANKSDRVEIGVGQVPQVADLDKAIAAGLLDAIKAGVNGTSWRVTAQDVSRSYIEGTPKNAREVEVLRERIYARLKGMRTGGFATREVFVAPLPDGSQWKGTEPTEYEQLYAAALVDAGMDADMALGIAANVAKALKK